MAKKKKQVVVNNKFLGAVECLVAFYVGKLTTEYFSSELCLKSSYYKPHFQLPVLIHTVYLLDTLVVG